LSKNDGKVSGCMRLSARKKFVLPILLFVMFLTLPQVFGATFASQVASIPASWTADPFVTKQLAENPQLIKRKLEAAMYKLLNHPSTLLIDLQSTNESDASYGKFDKIKVKTEKGEIDHLVLDKADLEFNNVHLDTAKLVLEEKIVPLKVDVINMNVRILENDLNKFLKEKSKYIKVDNPKVELKSGKIVLSGSTKYSLMKVSFWAAGNFGVQDSKSVWFYAKTIKVNGLGMPKPFIGSIVKRINPILNLEKFPFRLNLKEIRIENGALHFSSTGN